MRTTLTKLIIILVLSSCDGTSSGAKDTPSDDPVIIRIDGGRVFSPNHGRSKMQTLSGDQFLMLELREADGCDVSNSTEREQVGATIHIPYEHAVVGTVDIEETESSVSVGLVEYDENGVLVSQKAWRIDRGSIEIQEVTEHTIRGKVFVYGSGKTSEVLVNGRFEAVNCDE